MFKLYQCYRKETKTEGNYCFPPRNRKCYWNRFRCWKIIGQWYVNMLVAFLMVVVTLVSLICILLLKCFSGFFYPAYDDVASNTKLFPQPKVIVFWLVIFKNKSQILIAPLRLLQVIFWLFLTCLLCFQIYPIIYINVILHLNN